MLWKSPRHHEFVLLARIDVDADGEEAAADERLALHAIASAEA